MKWLLAWWRQPEGYYWLSDYVESRHLRGVARRLSSGTSATLALLPLWTLIWPPRPIGAGTRCVLGAAAVAMLGCAIYWWTLKWPTRRGSIVFITVLTGAVGISGLAQPTPLIALVGAATCASPRVYAGIVHTFRQLVFLVPFAMGCACVAIWRVSSDDLLQAGWMLLAMTLILTTSLLAGQVLVQASCVDAMQSDIDGLTGLLNRRAFFRRAHDLLARSSDVPVAVLMIDLDDFKRINDTSGHAAGDRVIADVAAVLQTTVGPAVAARTGGEEFVVIATAGDAEVEALAEQIRRRIEVMPATITASVGIACASNGNDGDVAHLQTD